METNQVGASKQCRGIPRGAYDPGSRTAAVRRTRGGGGDARMRCMRPLEQQSSWRHRAGSMRLMDAAHPPAACICHWLSRRTSRLAPIQPCRYDYCPAAIDKVVLRDVQGLLMVRIETNRERQAKEMRPLELKMGLSTISPLRLELQQAKPSHTMTPPASASIHHLARLSFPFQPSV